MAIGRALGKLFLWAAGGTGAAAGYAHLSKEENREELAKSVKQTASEIADDPIGKFNTFAEGSLEVIQNADKHVTNYGNKVLKAGETTIEVVSDPVAVVERKANETMSEAFGLNADGEENKGGGLMKWLLGGGAALAIGGLISKFFGKKDNENDSGGGLGIAGTLVLAGAAIAAVTDAWGIRTKITNMFNSKSDPDSFTTDLTNDTSAEQNVRVNNTFFATGPSAPEL